MEMYEETRPNMLHMIEEGFQVFDAEGLKIGKVKSIYFPSASIEPNLDDFPRNPNDRNLPQELRYRLLRSGFIRVNVGWLAKDRIVPLDQIEGVAGEATYLKEKYASLMTI